MLDTFPATCLGGVETARQTQCHHSHLATLTPSASPPLLQAKFIKLVRESELLVEGQLTSTDADIIFAKCKQRSARRISFEQVGGWVLYWLGGDGWWHA